MNPKSLLAWPGVLFPAVTIAGFGVFLFALDLSIPAEPYPAILTGDPDALVRNCGTAPAIPPLPPPGTAKKLGIPPPPPSARGEIVETIECGMWEAEIDEEELMWVEEQEPLPAVLFDARGNLIEGDPVDLLEGYSEEVVCDCSQPFVMSEEMPEFPGGEVKLFEYLARNVRYPTCWRDGSYYGRVYIEFVVSCSGKLTNLKILRSPHEEMSKEALRLIREMPDWKPGKQRGKPVPVTCRLPITWCLR